MWRVLASPGHTACAYITHMQLTHNTDFTLHDMTYFSCVVNLHSCMDLIITLPNDTNEAPEHIALCELGFQAGKQWLGQFYNLQHIHQSACSSIVVYDFPSLISSSRFVSKCDEREWVESVFRTHLQCPKALFIWIEVKPGVANMLLEFGWIRKAQPKPVDLSDCLSFCPVVKMIHARKQATVFGSYKFISFFIHNLKVCLSSSQICTANTIFHVDNSLRLEQ